MNWLFEEASNITNDIKFRKTLLRVFDAHACHVRLSHGTEQPNVKFDICTKCTRETLKKYFRTLAQKLGFQKTKHSDTDTPANLWKTIYEHTPECHHKIHALLFGVDPELFNVIKKQKNKFFIAIKFQSGPTEQQSMICTDNVNDLTLPYSDYKDSMFQALTFEGEINSNDVICPDDIPTNLLKKIIGTAKYHLLGDNPVSFISIPISFRRDPSGHYCDFLSIEAIWLNIPLKGKYDDIIKAIQLASYVAPKIIFQMNTENSFNLALRLSKLIKERGSSVHNRNDWLDKEKCKQFLESHAQYLFNDHFLETACNYQFFFGMERLAGLENTKFRDNFDLGALYAIATIHMLMRNKDKAKPSNNENNKIVEIKEHETDVVEIVGLKVDYKKWSEFLANFDQGKNTYKDWINKIELYNKCLILNFHTEDSVKGLKSKVLALYHDNTIIRHETAKAFHDTFFCEEPKNTLITIKSENYEALIGTPNSSVSLTIEFNSKNKLIRIEVSRHG